MEPIAAYADGNLFGTYGRRSYTLFEKRIAVSVQAAGNSQEATVDLAQLIETPVWIKTFSRAFRTFGIIAASTVFLLVVSLIIFGPDANFSRWWWGGSVFALTGGIGQILTSRRLEIASFPNSQGMTVLSIVGVRANRVPFHEFVDAVQKQIVIARSASSDTK